MVLSHVVPHVVTSSEHFRICSTICDVTMLCLCSINLSVMLVDCDHNAKSGNCRLTGCLGYMHVEANLDHCILINSRPVGMKNVEFCISTASNGLHVMLSQHLISFLLYDSVRVSHTKIRGMGVKKRI